MDQSLTQYVDTLFNNMQSFSQKDGLIGKAVTQGDKTFLPIMSITLGYGGGDTQAKAKPAGTTATAGTAGAGNFFTGALGLGAKLSTDAVIVIDKGNVMMAPVGSPGNIGQMINKIPEIIGNMKAGGQNGGQSGGQQSGQSAQPTGQSGTQNKGMS